MTKNPVFLDRCKAAPYVVMNPYWGIMKTFATQEKALSVHEHTPRSIIYTACGECGVLIAGVKPLPFVCALCADLRLILDKSSPGSV